VRHRDRGRTDDLDSTVGAGLHCWRPEEAPDPEAGLREALLAGVDRVDRAAGPQVADVVVGALAAFPDDRSTGDPEQVR
jgi:hypothetical protein